MTALRTARRADARSPHRPGRPPAPKPCRRCSHQTTPASRPSAPRTTAGPPAPERGFGSVAIPGGARPTLRPAQQAGRQANRHTDGTDWANKTLGGIFRHLWHQWRQSLRRSQRWGPPAAAGAPSERPPSLPALHDEWFTADGITNAAIDYDLGKIYHVYRFALWVEDAAGVRTFSVMTSIDGSTFTPPGTIFTAIDNPNGSNYPAQVCSSSPINARYISLDFFVCSQQPAEFNGCSLGEIAFDVGSARPDPAVPGPLTLVGTASAFAMGRRLRHRRACQASGTDAAA